MMVVTTAPAYAQPKTPEELEAFLAVMTDDYDKAARLLKPMAEKGDALAQDTLGLYYLKGLGVKQDFVEAKRWLEKASAQGYGESTFTLAMMYDQGVGLTKDDMRAARLYEKAAEQGNKKAPGHLASKYYQGKGVPKDMIYAYVWSNIGAAVGDEQAKTARDELEKVMPEKQVHEAQRIARDWFGQHRKNQD
jgi:hypothetical protein